MAEVVTTEKGGGNWSPTVNRKSLKTCANNFNAKKWKGGNEVQVARVNSFFKMHGKEEKR